jgi:Rrf2 family cysteine metabolism transcriptional repressor
VLELVELLDGPVGAGATGVFATAAAAVRAVLGDSTVSDVAEAEARATAPPMYHI